jgi:hypothetical protein
MSSPQSTSQLEVDVCELVHSFPERGLKLSSSCKLFLSYDIDTLEPGDSLPTPWTSRSRNLWISRGTGLSIIFTPEFEGLDKIDENSMEEFIEELGFYLRSPQVL